MNVSNQQQMGQQMYNLMIPQLTEIFNYSGVIEALRADKIASDVDKKNPSDKLYDLVMQFRDGRVALKFEQLGRYIHRPTRMCIMASGQWLNVEYDAAMGISGHCVFLESTGRQVCGAECNLLLHKYVCEHQALQMTMPAPCVISRAMLRFDCLREELLEGFGYPAEEIRIQFDVPQNTSQNPNDRTFAVRLAPQDNPETFLARFQAQTGARLTLVFKRPPNDTFNTWMVRVEVPENLKLKEAQKQAEKLEAKVLTGSWVQEEQFKARAQRPSHGFQRGERTPRQEPADHKRAAEGERGKRQSSKPKKQ